MVNILAVSDETSMHRNNLSLGVNDKVDILVNCGDLGPGYIEQLEMEFKPQMKIMVYGNHDKGAFLSDKLTNRDMTTGQDKFLPNTMRQYEKPFENKEFSDLYKSIVLNKATHTFTPGKNRSLQDRLRFAGFSGSMTEGMNKERKWPFYFTDKQAKRFARQLKNKDKWNKLFGKDFGIDIMMSHAAPDVDVFYGDLGSHHMPSEGLGDIYRELNPSLWLYGHIHPSYTKEKLDFRWKDSYMLNVVPFKFIRYDEKEKKVIDYYPR